jgi:hypothetical protein
MKVLILAAFTSLSAQAQFSTSVSVQSIYGDAYYNGQPISYVYNFSINGNFPDSQQQPYGLSIYLQGFGLQAIGGGFSASNVGGWLPSDPPEFQGDLASFEDYYYGGQVDGNISIATIGPLLDVFSWRINEITDEFQPYYLQSYNGTTSVITSAGVVIPEPANEFVFSLAALFLAYSIRNKHN